MHRRWGLALLVTLALTAACSDRSDEPERPPPPGEVPTPAASANGAAGLAVEPGEPTALERATVVRVIDGDTIDVRLEDGGVERVRYIGIDTPETVHPTRGVEPYGPEASAYNAALLARGTVLLEKDVSERDRFDRLLRYVWVEQPGGDFLFVNEALVLAGLAVVSTFPPDVKFVERFLSAQERARASGTGLWASEAAPATPGPAATPQPNAMACDPSYPDGCIPPPPPDLDCGDVPYQRFTVLSPDPHRFDADLDGIGCKR